MRLPGSELLLQEFPTETTLFESPIRHCADVNLAKKEASDRKPLQEQLLSEIHDQTPSLLAASFFDLKSEKSNAELISMSTENSYPIVQHTNETQEDIALKTDLSQQATLSISLVINFPHRHVATLTGAAA